MAVQVVHDQLPQNQRVIIAQVASSLLIILLLLLFIGPKTEGGNGSLSDVVLSKSMAIIKFGQKGRGSTNLLCELFFFTLTDFTFVGQKKKEKKETNLFSEE